MLQAVRGYPGLCTAHPDKRTFSYIIVNAIDIGVGMMNNIVLLFPDEAITS